MKRDSITSKLNYLWNVKIRHSITTKVMAILLITHNTFFVAENHAKVEWNAQMQNDKHMFNVESSKVFHINNTCSWMGINLRLAHFHFPIMANGWLGLRIQLYKFNFSVIQFHP